MFTDDQEKTFRAALLTLIAKWEKVGNEEVVHDLLTLHPSVLLRKKPGEAGP